MLDFSVTFFIALVNLAILFFALRAILFKPVTKFMEKRQAGVRAELDEADKKLEEAGALKKQYEAALEKARGDAMKILADAQAAALKDADAIRSEAKAEAEETLRRAHEETEKEKAAALAVFRKEASGLVVMAASRLLRREIENGDGQKIAGQILKDLAAAKGSP
jgi:F-type H+-transporting ATPase subunit b